MTDGCFTQGILKGACGPHFGSFPFNLTGAHKNLCAQMRILSCTPEPRRWPVMTYRLRHRAWRNQAKLPDPTGGYKISHASPQQQPPQCALIRISSCVTKMNTGRTLRAKSSPDNGLLEGDGIWVLENWRGF